MSIINNRMKVTVIKHVYFIKDNVREALEKKEQTCEDVVCVADDIQSILDFRVEPYIKKIKISTKRHIEMILLMWMDCG
jgi:hypothetical protein